MENLKKIAVLIDADNTQLIKLEAVLHELSTYGRIIVKKAYGNWKKSTLKNWESEVKRLAIKTEQQFDYISGKNTTDIAMIIDAMDLLHDDMYDAFALVSSDSDFTPLAIRLRESGAYVIGAGEKKTPEPFKNACDEFILLEYVTHAEEEAQALAEKVQAAKAVENTQQANEIEEEPAIDEIHNLIKIASDRFQDDDGFVNIASAGQFIKRAKPDFTPLTYGYSKLSELMKAFPDRYKLKRSNGKGAGSVITYRCL